MPRMSVYQRSPKKFSAAEKAQRIRRQIHMSGEGLERLRLPEKRPAVLGYDVEKR